MAIDPKLDGIEHVNIYSKGKTDLGRFLTNFAHTPIFMPEGKFASIEAYWYWLSIPDYAPERQTLATLYGYQAKSEGRNLRKKYPFVKVPDFEERIRLAVRTKLQTYPEYWQSSPHVNLPLEHYYVYHGKIYNMSRTFGWLTKTVREEMDAILYGQPN